MRVFPAVGLSFKPWSDKILRDTLSHSSDQSRTTTKVGLQYDYNLITWDTCMDLCASDYMYNSDLKRSVLWPTKQSVIWSTVRQSALGLILPLHSYAELLVNENWGIGSCWPFAFPLAAFAFQSY